MTALSKSQERVERSLFEHFRLALVEKGYLADITLFPDTDQGVLDYDAANQAIKATKGFFIDLYNNANARAKYAKQCARFVMITKRHIPGEVGMPPNPTPYTKVSGKYKFGLLPPQSTNIIIDIHLLAHTAEQSRVLHGMIGLVLSKRQYLKYYDNPAAPDPASEDRFFIYQTYYNDLDDATEGVIEKVYSYLIPEVYDREIVDTHEAAAIESITVETYLTDNPDTENPDTLTVSE